MVNSAAELSRSRSPAVARVERSETRVRSAPRLVSPKFIAALIPDFAPLNPGYLLWGSIALLR
jgi:hypothetical protein